MVIKTLKTNTIALLSLAAVLLATACIFTANSSAEEVDFQVDITEVLSVSLTTPDTWASGDVSMSTGSDFLRNKINLNVQSNNPNGFSAFMASKTTTNLVNTAKSSAIIETLASSSTVANFPNNRWGYSVDDTDAGSSTANYSALQTSLITLASPTAPATLDKDIFFGAKADATKDSGTYANTVVFSVVSGYVDPVDPVIPDNPVTPANDTPNDGGATYNGSYTVYTTTASSGDSTTTNTKINSGDTRSNYTDPQGVVSNVNSGNNLATGLAIASVAAAASGTFFFILAKRKKDDDEDEEEI